MTEEKTGDFMEKPVTTTEVPMCLPFEYATGYHSKQLKPCLCVVQNYRFQFKTVIGEKMDCYQNIICLSFPLRKIKPIKRNSSSKKFILDLTRKFRNRISCPLRTRSILCII